MWSFVGFRNTSRGAASSADSSARNAPLPQAASAKPVEAGIALTSKSTSSSSSSSSSSPFFFFFPTRLTLRSPGSNEGADDTRCEWCYLSNKRRPSISCTVAATSNAFLTSPASSYYAYLQQTQPGNTFVKHPPSPPSTASVRGIGGGVGRMRGIGAPAPGAGGVVAGRHFQNEAIVRRRGLLNN